MSKVKLFVWKKKRKEGKDKILNCTLDHPEISTTHNKTLPAFRPLFALALLAMEFCFDGKSTWKEAKRYLRQRNKFNKIQK